MFAIAIHQVATQLLIHADGVVPDPAPSLPAGFSAGGTVVAWIKGGALLCCLAAAIIGGGMIALGNTSRRAEMAERGKVTLICAMGASIIIAAASTLITSSYSLG